jgi:hypothetical protein
MIILESGNMESITEIVEEWVRKGVRYSEIEPQIGIDIEFRGKMILEIGS